MKRYDYHYGTGLTLQVISNYFLQSSTEILTFFVDQLNKLSMVPPNSIKNFTILQEIKSLHKVYLE